MHKSVMLLRQMGQMSMSRENLQRATVSQRFTLTSPVVGANAMPDASDMMVGEGESGPVKTGTVACVVVVFL